MEISDDDRPPPSVLPTYDEGDDSVGVDDGKDRRAGVCPGTRPVDPAEGSLVAMIKDVDPPDALPPSRHGQDGGSSAVPDGEGPHLSGHGPGGTPPRRLAHPLATRLPHQSPVED